MKKLVVLLCVMGIGSGCATPPREITDEEWAAGRAESARRVKAYLDAGLDPGSSQDAYEQRLRDYETHKRTAQPLAPLERLGTQWQSRQPAAAQSPTTCRQESLRDPATGLYKQYRICD